MQGVALVYHGTPPGGALHVLVDVEGPSWSCDARHTQSHAADLNPVFSTDQLCGLGQGT